MNLVNNRPYFTQMEAARKGIVTPEMKVVAEKENRDTEFIRQMVAEGKVVIPANPGHKGLDPNGVGSMLKTKINVNLVIPKIYLCFLLQMLLPRR